MGSVDREITNEYGGSNGAVWAIALPVFHNPPIAEQSRSAESRIHSWDFCIAVK